jgi:transcriptional regulator GlxA family with amidase domain
MKITFLLFENFTALDVVGPFEVLSRIPDGSISFVAMKAGDYHAPKGLSIRADFQLNEITSPDIVVIPGGFGIDVLLNDPVVISWLQKVHQTSTWTTAVCSGSLLLATAGILKNKKATTHWLRKEQLRSYGVDVVDERYVHDGKIITSAGVSAGIDMALYLLSLIVNENFAKAIQLSMEYDPQPPFDAGSPEKAPKEIVEKIRQVRK